MAEVLSTKQLLNNEHKKTTRTAGSISSGKSKVLCIHFTNMFSLSSGVKNRLGITLKIKQECNKYLISLCFRPYSILAVGWDQGTSTLARSISSSSLCSKAAWKILTSGNLEAKASSSVALITFRRTSDSHVYYIIYENRGICISKT